MAAPQEPLWKMGNAAIRPFGLIRAAFCAAAAGGVVSGALAQDSAAPTPGPAPSAEPAIDPSLQSSMCPWTVQIRPRVWWLSPSGKLEMPATTSGATDNGDHVRVEDLNLDTPRFGPYGEVQIAADEWRFSFSGGAFSLDRNHTTADTSFSLGDMHVSPGDSLALSFDFTTIEATVGYRLWTYDFKAHSVRPEDAFDSVVSIYGLGGVRMYDFDIEASHNGVPGSGAQRVHSEQLFVEPIIGARMEVELARHFGIDLELTGGGFGDSDRSSISIDVAIAFAWRPCDSVGVEIGWRQLAFRASDGQSPTEFDYNGRMAGLFAGLSIRF